MFGLRGALLTSCIVAIAPFSGDESRGTLHGAYRYGAQNGCPTTVTYSFYEISGVNRDEVTAQMFERGPVDNLGRRRFAYTRWNISWAWPRTAGGKNDYLGTQVTCTAHVVLPRLRPARGMTTQFIEKWNGFVERLREHEFNHIRNAEMTAPLIRDSIVRAARQGEIAKADDANRIGFGVVEAIHTFDERYDKLTVHGHTEGVTL